MSCLRNLVLHVSTKSIALYLYFKKPDYLFVMKKLYLFVFAAVLSLNLSAQYTTNSFVHGGVTRQYLLYVPASYDGSKPVPFIMALHGLGDK